MKAFRYDDRLYHLVTTFEDNGKKFYVFKFFGKYKRWWHYELWSELEYDDIIVRRANKQKEKGNEE